MIEALTRFWDWVDKRDIDKHLVVLMTWFATVRITAWGMSCYRDWVTLVAAGHAVSGTDAAALVAAVMVPWGYVVQAVMKWYFESRPST